MKALQASTDRLAPADDAALARAIKAVVSFGRAFGLPVPQMAQAVSIYRATLGHLPADILQAAVRETLAGWTWGNRLPLPGDILRTADTELARRKFEHLRLEFVESVFRRQERSRQKGNSPKGRFSEEQCQKRQSHR